MTNEEAAGILRAWVENMPTERDKDAMYHAITAIETLELIRKVCLGWLDDKPYTHNDIGVAVILFSI